MTKTLADVLAKLASKHGAKNFSISVKIEYDLETGKFCVDRHSADTVEQALVSAMDRDWVSLMDNPIPRMMGKAVKND